MPTITFSGLTSGLDTSSWVEALVSVKQTTITDLQAQQEAQRNLLNVVNNIKSFFTSFQTCLQKITDSQFGISSLDLFAQNLANSSNVNILTATATTEAARQTYNVNVDQLATSTKATSGYTQTETKFATLDTTLGQLGAKSGTITANSQTFSVSENDTLKTLIKKFSDIGIVASFDAKKSKFTINANLNEIDDGTTNLKNVLGLKNTAIQGATSGSIVYADKDTEFSKLGLSAGKVMIEGQEHIITKTGDNYTINKSGQTATTMNTLGDFLEYLKSSAVNAESATIDDKGNISIRGAVIESVAGGSNIKDVLKLSDVTERTVMESGSLTWQKDNFASLTTRMKDLGIASGQTLIINSTTSNISENNTIDDIKTILNSKGISLTVDDKGVITIDTKGAEVSGTILDALGLKPDKSGTIFMSGGHTVTYKADGNTTLSQLGITNTMTYTAYNSEGTAITGSINNNANLTVDGFISKLQGQGLNAHFDTETQKIIIDDGYITGDIATALGMSSTTVTHQEVATTSTTLEKLGAIGFSLLSIDGGPTAMYSKDTTLNTIINDITAAGGTVEFRDGTMSVSGVTLSGTLTALLGFEATTQGTSVTSDSLSYIKQTSSIISDDVTETVRYDIDLTSKIGDITGTTTNYTLTVNGTSTTLNPDSTLSTISNAVTAAGGTFKINDDNTITIEGVTLGGTIVPALGLASAGQATTMSSNSAITVGGVENVATVDTTLAQLGAAGNTALSINGGAEKTYADTTQLSTIFADIQAAGGTAKIENGIITVEGVTLSGTAVDIMKLESVKSGTTVISADISYISHTEATSSDWLYPQNVNKISESTQLMYLNKGSDRVVCVSDVDTFETGKTYYVSDVEDLNKLAALTNSGVSTEGVNFVLYNNIDMSSVDNFEGIGNTTYAFRGNFDGNNYEISNLKMSNSAGSRYGLFGFAVNSTIENLGVTNATITSKETTGVLIGQLNGGTVKNCWSSGSVTGTGYYVGGLIGLINDSDVSNSYSSVTVRGLQSVGGLIGQIYRSNVSSSGASGVVSGDITGNFSGNVNASTIKNCYASGSNSSGFAWMFSGSSAVNIIDCVYATTSLISSSSKYTATNCARLTTTEMQDKAVMSQYGFTEHNGWTFESGLPSLMGTTNGNTLYINGTKYTYSPTATLSSIMADIRLNGGEMVINSDSTISVSGVRVAGGLANRLGLTSTSDGTTMSSNDPLVMDQSFIIDKNTTFGGSGSNSFGISSSEREYTIYDSYGNLIAAKSTDGSADASGTYKTVENWLTTINNKMNAYYGTSGVEYASLKDGVISISGGYVTGSLANAIGIETISTATGKQLTGGRGTYTENNSKFIDAITDYIIPDGAQCVSEVTTFTSGKTYLISTAADLQQLSTLVNSGKSTSGATFVMTDDIDMASVSNFAPIGDYSNGKYFRGTFLGNGHEVSNLTINSPDKQFNGLFGYVLRGTIKDVGLSNVNINGLGETGALTGGADQSVISNCYVTGGNITAKNIVGGLIGRICGLDTSKATVSNCYASIDVSGASSQAGGFSGIIYGADVSNCFATGNVTNGAYAIGGFTGEVTKAETTIRNCYSTGDVISNTNCIVGGFVGATMGHVENCYSTGNASTLGTGSLGSFVGYTHSGAGSFTDCYYNNAVGPENGGTSAGVSGISGKSTADMLLDPNFPNLLGKNSYITRNIQKSTVLGDITSSTSDRNLRITIDGTTHSKSFAANDTVQDVVDYINTLGVEADFEDLKLSVKSNTTQNLSISGALGDILTAGDVTESQIFYTTTSANKIYYTKNNIAISEATRVADIIGSETTGNLNIMINDTTPVSLSYGADSTLGDVISDLALYGITASIDSTGVFSLTSNNKIEISGSIGNALIGDSGSVSYFSSEYASGELSALNWLELDGNVTLSSLGVKSGSIQILDGDGKLINTIEVDESQTLSQLSSSLSAYGFNLNIDSTNAKITISTDSDKILADGSSNLISALKIKDEFVSTESVLEAGTTLAQMGFANGSSLSILLDGQNSVSLSFGANNTLQDIMDSLSAFGINATVSTSGAFSATSDSHSFMFSGELGSYLTQGATGYTNHDIAYESSEALKYNTDTKNLSADTSIEDLLGAKQGGTLRITQGDNIINLDYDANDTVQDVIDDLNSLGINAEISSTGVFSATSTDTTFVLSGNIGRALQGSSPTYTDVDVKYNSDDLSYVQKNGITNSSILADIGISSGDIFVVDQSGNVINSITIDNSMTIAQAKSALTAYGFNLGITDRFEVTITSNDGYTLIDGSSNMISAFKIDGWNTTTSDLTTDTTVAEMGFKEGANLNLFMDGNTSTTISFTATDTVQDIINALKALGIDAAIETRQGLALGSTFSVFTAQSTEHSFVLSGDIGKFLTNGTTGYVNTDKGYVTESPLMYDVPVVTDTSKSLSYSHDLNPDDTVESMGFSDGAVLRVILDGDTPYAFSFTASDTMQDIIDTLATYGIRMVGTNGQVSFSSPDHTVTLGGALGAYLTQGGTYNDKVTGYKSDSITYNTTERIDTGTKLSDLGVASGDINIIKDGNIAGTINITDETTLGQLFNAIKVYGMQGSILTDALGNKSIQIYADGDTRLADGTCDVVSSLGLNIINQGDYDSHIEYWDTGVTSGLLTEDTLLISLDKDGKTSVGSLIFETGTGADVEEHIINLTAADTIKTFLEKMRSEGVNAVLENGIIRIDNSVDGITFTGGSSEIFDTFGITLGQVDTYASSENPVTYQTDVTYSVANYADGDTTLSTVNVTDGNMSIFVDGIKATVTVNGTDTFSDVFSKISSEVAAKTGVTVKAGFIDTDGNIVTDPTEAKNTGVIVIEVVGDHSIVIGASNDTTNFATIANLKQETTSKIAGTRALYKVNGNSLITASGLFKQGDITEGDFTIGDATFTIDSTTTLNSLINQINKSDKSYASAYWDTLSGTFVIQSTVTGESLINIEAGSSNFTDVMGFTKVVDGEETLVTDKQTLGQNAIIRINGTTVTSASNIITSDISKIKGLTINLKNVSAGETVTITVEQDKEGIYNAINDIVDAYNTLMEGLEKELTKGGSFEHDTMFKMIKNNLKKLMTQSIGGTTVFRNLASIGISTGAAQDSISTDVTKLIIDKDKLMEALEKDSDAVKQLLVGTKDNQGVLLKALGIVDNSLRSTGYISTTENSINKKIKKMDNKITSLSESLARYRQQLENKFGSMERIISNMQNSYSSFLTAS